MTQTLGDNDVTRRISNSEVATWLACERKYYYEFDLELEPRTNNTAPGKGIVLHEVLAAYYQALKDGIKHDEAVIVARRVLMKHMEDGGAMYSLDTITEVDMLLRGYWAFYQGDPDWEILAVEAGYDLDINEIFSYSLRLDLLVRSRSTNKVILVDHKTAYNFWSESDLSLNPQFPKYIGALRANGTHVDYAILNQVRTRKINNPSSDQLFKRVKYVPSIAKLQRVMKEQVIASGRIAAHRMLPLEVRGENSLRCLNTMVCKYCHSKPLCESEFDGGDITYQIETDYKQRTYGYNATTSNEIEDLL